MSENTPLLGTVDKGSRYIGYGLMLLGAIAVVAPMTSGLALAFTIGLLLLAAGALIVTFGRRARAAGKGGTLLIIGALAILCGLVLVFQPSSGLSVVRWILIPYLVISGISEVAFALRLSPEEGWRETLGGGIVSVLAGLILLTGWPISGARAIGLLVGAKLVTSGWAVLKIHRALEAAGDKLRSARNAVARLREDRPL